VLILKFGYKGNKVPKQNDTFTITLGKTHLGWGTHRYTSSREIIYNEGYLPIPKDIAIKLNIYMSNKKDANIIYNFSTSDGFYSNEELKASGCSNAGDIYAKNLAGNGDLKLLGKWFTHINAIKGDKIKISFTSPTHIILSKA
jgi:hypothetical protein